MNLRQDIAGAPIGKSESKGVIVGERFRRRVVTATSQQDLLYAAAATTSLSYQS
jgi:hypothetical protein